MNISQTARDLMAAEYEASRFKVSAAAVRNGKPGPWEIPALRAIERALSSPPTVGETDEDGAILRMLNALHPNRGENPEKTAADPHFMAMSDLSDDQAERARAAVRAVRLSTLPPSDHGVREALGPFADVCIGRESYGDQFEIEIELPPHTNVHRARLLMCEFRRARDVLASLDKEGG